MKLQMLKTMPGSPDGLHVHEYAEGLHEDVADELALAFIGMGVAKRPDAETPEDGAPAMETPEIPFAAQPLERNTKRIRKTPTKWATEDA